MEGMQGEAAIPGRRGIPGMKVRLRPIPIKTVKSTSTVHLFGGCIILRNISHRVSKVCQVPRVHRG